MRPSGCSDGRRRRSSGRRSTRCAGCTRRTQTSSRRNPRVWTSSTTPRSVNVNRNYRKDGSVIWCEWYDSAIYDADGHMVSILSLVLDITTRKAGPQTELEAERTRLREIIEDIPIGVALVGPDGSVLEVNEPTNHAWAGDTAEGGVGRGVRIYEAYSRDTGKRLEPNDWPATRSLSTGRGSRDGRHRPSRRSARDHPHRCDTHQGRQGQRLLALWSSPRT